MRTVPRVWHLASDRLFVAGALSNKTGVAGIAERSRRPQLSPRRNEAAIEQQVVGLRRRYPDWGARKLRVLLQEQGIELARNTIHRILLRHDLVRPEDRHRASGAAFRAQRAQRAVADGLQRSAAVASAVGPLSVLDDHSRYLVALQPVGSTRGELVREQLETAFVGCGRAGGDADGPRHSVVERASAGAG